MYSEIHDEYAFARPYLAPGEIILWRGKPEKGHLLGPQDAFLIPFSIFWCGFAIFWFVSALQVGAFALFGVPFVCVGLYITVGRFFHTAYLRKRTAYVITTGKILRKRGQHIDMLDTKTLPPIQIQARADGTGTILFGQPTYYYHRRRHGSWGPDQAMFSLDNIPDVARVQQILHSIAGN